MAGLPHITRQVTDTSEVIPGLDASTAMFTHVGGTPETKEKASYHWNSSVCTDLEMWLLFF